MFFLILSRILALSSSALLKVVDDTRPDKLKSIDDVIGDKDSSLKEIKASLCSNGLMYWIKS